jgi:hypothetical protein
MIPTWMLVYAGLSNAVYNESTRDQVSSRPQPPFPVQLYKPPRGFETRKTEEKEAEWV